MHTWDCDGYGASHNPEAILVEPRHGLYAPGCSAGCKLDVVGSAGSPETARAMALECDHPWHTEDICEGCGPDVDEPHDDDIAYPLTSGGAGQDES